MYDEKAYRKAHYEANKEEAKAYNKAYFKDYYKANKEKLKSYQKDYYEDNSEKVKAYSRDYWLKKRYGLKRADYDNKLITQFGRCEICNSPFRNTPCEPSVDHNHTTGEIRDLLCIPCNMRIGVLESSMFPKYQAYLKRHKYE